MVQEFGTKSSQTLTKRNEALSIEAPLAGSLERVGISGWISQSGRYVLTTQFWKQSGALVFYTGAFSWARSLSLTHPSNTNEKAGTRLTPINNILIFFPSNCYHSYRTRSRSSLKLVDWIQNWWHNVPCTQSGRGIWCGYFYTLTMTCFTIWTLQRVLKCQF